MKENAHKEVPVGKLIAIAIVVIVVAALMNPRWLFFLTLEQQQVIADFQKTYFTSALPISGPEGGFDWLRLGALALLFAECWVVNSVVALVAKHWTLKNRHAETLKGLACNCLRYAVVI
ncbi:MAG: hypothetical protein RR336_10665 [Oscillospiraceae bacterium]